MIITCEHCTTRFQLDASRIPAEGAKVRCSRCKHAFFVKRSELEVSSDRHAAEALAREAWAGGSGAGDASDSSGTGAASREAEGQDDGDPTALFGKMTDVGTGGAEAAEEESDWEFAEEPEAGEPAGPPTSTRAAPAPSPAEVPDPVSELFADGSESEEASLERLGDPEEWDLLGDQTEVPAPEPAAWETPGPEPPGSAASGSAGEDFATDPAGRAPAVAGREQDRAAAQPAPPDRERRSDVLELAPASEEPPAWRRAALLAAWAGVALLALWTAAASVLGTGVPLAPAALGPHAQPTPAVGGLFVERAEGRIVENAHGGFLLVVRATLRNPEDAPRLAEGALGVELLDASGAPVETSPLVRRLPEELLRLGEIPTLRSRLVAAGRELTWTPFAPGEAMEVEAVFPSMPERARAFRFAMLSAGQAEGAPPPGEVSSPRSPTSSGTRTSPAPPPSPE